MCRGQVFDPTCRVPDDIAGRCFGSGNREKSEGELRIYPVLTKIYFIGIVSQLSLNKDEEKPTIGLTKRDNHYTLQVVRGEGGGEKKNNV